jgi:hypothetical protein
MGRGWVHTEIWWGKLKVKDHLADSGMYGRIILKWIFMKWNGVWSDRFVSE